jgi:peroxiredoxin Q/BCP
VTTSQPPGGCVVVIRVGDPAPYFTLVADDGCMVSLASLEGKNIVLFFYPKDNTSG